MFPVLESVTAYALTAVETVGLPVLVFLFVLKGALVGKVVPTSVVLPGYVLATGATYRNALLVVALVTVAHLVGQLLIYGGSRRYGETLFEAVPYVNVDVESGQLQRLDQWFNRYGGVAVFATNVVPWSRGLIAIPAGMSSYPVGRYTLHTTTSTFICHGVYAVAPVVGLGLLS